MNEDGLSLPLLSCKLSVSAGLCERKSRFAQLFARLLEKVKCVCWCVGENGRSQFDLGESEQPCKEVRRRAWGMKKLCMMPCHSCYVYGISRSKEVGMGRGFKVIIWGASHKGKRPIFMGGVEPSRPHVSSQVFGLILCFLNNRWL